MPSVLEAGTEVYIEQKCASGNRACCRRIVLSQLLIVALFLYLGTVKCCGKGSQQE